ncbi:MAG TPA: hypothetical protein VK149_13535 [Sideroxyarcus sp.]|nr:hypothetical protein [Sideroxyarcus sp.]
MNGAQNEANSQPQCQGIWIRESGEATRQHLRALLRDLAIEAQVEMRDETAGICLRLTPQAQRQLAPACDTLQLCTSLRLTPHADLDKEIMLALLASPVAFEYPDHAELVAAIRMRRYIVEAARRTALDFHTTRIERPEDYWTYTEDSGFTVLPGKPLIEALRKATQPEVSGRRYAFSCYRASEYVMLLGIAQELATSNPALLEQLQRYWERQAIQSRRFHDAFMREYGSMEQPLPMAYYVPGDRLWFRNPDERSSDVSGYEGSWVIYLGSGLFTNFWKCEQPFSLTEKCIEIYHWRHGVFEDENGELQMDERIVEAHVQETLRNPAETAHILQRMLRLRDPSGSYAEGGCIDTTRECPRWVCAGTTDIVLPG